MSVCVCLAVYICKDFKYAGGLGCNVDIHKNFEIMCQKGIAKCLVNIFVCWGWEGEIAVFVKG